MNLMTDEKRGAADELPFELSEPGAGPVTASAPFPGGGLRPFGVRSLTSVAAAVSRRAERLALLARRLETVLARHATERTCDHDTVRARPYLEAAANMDLLARSLLTLRRLSARIADVELADEALHAMQQAFADAGPLDEAPERLLAWADALEAAAAEAGLIAEIPAARLGFSAAPRCLRVAGGALRAAAEVGGAREP